MSEDSATAQAGAVVRLLAEALPARAVRGVYLYGSAVAGGLRPESDLDLLAVVDRRLTPAERRAILSRLLPISGRVSRPAAWRPIELTLVVHDDVRPWRYPPRIELQYGEWLRTEALADAIEPREASPDAAILISMVRDSGRALVGPPASAVLDAVPAADVARAMVDELPPLLEDLEHDTRNVLLTLARMWSTLATGDIRSKDAAVDWVLPRLAPVHRAIMELARDAYLGTAADAWAGRMPAARAAADAMVTSIGALPPTDASV